MTKLDGFVASRCELNQRQSAGILNSLNSETLIKNSYLYRFSA